MKMKRLLVAAPALALAVMAGASHMVEASDHDDGEIDLKGRSLNLTDHYAFKSGTNLSLIMYVNPRSLPGRQYFLSTDARYEFHVSRAASRVSAPTAAEDYIFRIEAGAPTAAGVQPLTLTVLTGGTTVVGTATGMSTAFAASKANAAGLGNTGTVGPFANMQFFVGQRADSFYFDVNRFFQVRSFLAGRFFGNGATGDATASLAPNCRGDAFLAGSLGQIEPNADHDGVNLWNPPSCAPDFTKNLNVTAIAINVPISALGGGTVFDTWSTISIKEVN